MLVVKICADNDQIDEICIQNRGELAGHSGFYLYRIVKPEGHDGRMLVHRRSDGYKPLLSMVLQEIIFQKKGGPCRTSAAPPATMSSKPPSPKTGSASGAAAETSMSSTSRRPLKNS
jgi:hypothetical protein